MGKLRLHILIALITLSLVGLIGCESKFSKNKSDADLDPKGAASDTANDNDRDGTPDKDDPDDDNDGIADGEDNCPLKLNPMQEDKDGDGVGDLCDDDSASGSATVDPQGKGPPDSDKDGVPDASDNCPNVPNADQANNYGSALLGDACEDSDEDGWLDIFDFCPTTPAYANTDTDGDNVGNLCDNCPNNINPDQTDTNGDGYGDACQPPTAQFVYFNSKRESITNIYRVSTEGNNTNEQTVTHNASPNNILNIITYPYIAIHPDENLLFYIKQTILLIFIPAQNLSSSDTFGQDETLLDEDHHLLLNQGLTLTPDGSKLIVANIIYKEGEILEPLDDILPNLYSINLNNSSITNWTNNESPEQGGFEDIALSPNNDFMVYVSQTDIAGSMKPKIWFKEINGTTLTDAEPVRLVSGNDYYEQWPAISPDGTKIIYSKVKPGGAGITGKNKMYYKEKSADFPFHLVAEHAIAKPDGGNYNDSHPSWCPDGSIVFSSNRDGDFEIYKMNLDGTNLVKLTNNDVEDREPVCAPKPLFITPPPPLP
jgi:Tol biopolymer transport system component